MNYNETLDAWRTILMTPSSEIDFTRMVPRAIEAAELKIYRDMDFLYTITTGTNALTSGVREINLPTGIIILRSVNLVLPSSATDPDIAQRIPLTRSTNEYLDMVYGNASLVAQPTTYAMLSDTEVLVGPYPDQNYTLEFTGTFRPAVLSASNSPTFLTTNMPDLYVASGMIWWAGYYQNFGQGSDNPQLATSWESIYTKTLSGINMETIRQKAASYSWTPYQPTPQANIARERGAPVGPPPT